MGSLTIKLPDKQKSEIEALAKKKNYNSTSEYVREALRDKVEKDLILRPEGAEELKNRLQQLQKDDSELISHEEISEELKDWMEINWHPDARKDLQEFKTEIQRKILDGVKELENQPLGENTSIVSKQVLKYTGWSWKTED